MSISSEPVNFKIVSVPSVTVGDPVVVPEYADVGSLRITIPEPPEPPPAKQFPQL